jgi:23S rRNA (guanosine2251-2'-O)-methyltransferase
LSPAAVKASAGAVEHLLLCPVDDLPGALADLRAHGLRVAGSEADAPLTARQTDLRGPLAIVVGSEGQGLGPAVRRRCDAFMRIPMRGAIGSLNAAVAGSVLLFEAVAQRYPDGRGPEAAARPLAPKKAPTHMIDAEMAEPERPIADETTTPLATAEPTGDEPTGDTEIDLLPGGPPVPDGPKAKKPRAPRAPRTPTRTPSAVDGQ